MNSTASDKPAFRAMKFARERHRNQVRNYTGDGYIIHLNEVAGLVASLAGFLSPADLEHALVLAYLHDCVEDQGVTHAELTDDFGRAVADDVLDLSDMETGNRHERHGATLVRLAAANAPVQTVKCGDILSNTANMHKNDPRYAWIYNHLKLEVLEVLTKAPVMIRELAISQCQANIEFLTRAGGHDQ